ncbi:uncharacterized protein At1g01500 [Carica papaya]|uniref:uncharacterized protein At1g01500 n=1 Tax=Carica papaya TaxID=3649 RepID=UPI000B8CA953|nr:uncharacterized protein At1g01500 [Carica papaya]
MESPCRTTNNGEVADPCLQIIRYSPYQPCAKLPSPWFDLRVFYVRVSNVKVDDSTPEFLTLSHIPLSPDTLLEVNGVRSSIYSDGVSSLLRRDRADKQSEEATFVSTDSIRLTGSVKFEVYDKDDVILSGFLEMSNSKGLTGESKNNMKRWNMNCESEITAGTGFLKGKQITSSELTLPTIEVYYDLQPAEYTNYKQENDEDYSNMYWRRTEYIDGEDGELSWFNAGVRVGVGIGLGICLGVGIGVGILVRTYQATTRNFKRRLI